MADPSSTTRRRVRERDLVVATRALFDERGMQDAPIEEIAQAVGIARGLIYRVFSSKEELFVLTVTDYLSELDELLGAAVVDAETDPIGATERCLEAYAGFCLRYPAFLDCSLSLMNRPARELQDTISEAVWLRLGTGMARCVSHVARVLHAGVAARTFTIADPDLMANVLWTQTLGAMHLARIRVGMRETAPGVPDLFRVEPETVVRTCVASALATVGARR